MIVYQIAFSYSMPLPGIVEIAAENEEEAKKIFDDMSKDMDKVTIVSFKAVGEADDDQADSIPAFPPIKLN